jgi:hypothetical protein
MAMRHLYMAMHRLKNLYLYQKSVIYDKFGTIKFLRVNGIQWYQDCRNWSSLRQVMAIVARGGLLSFPPIIFVNNIADFAFKTFQGNDCYCTPDCENLCPRMWPDKMCPPINQSCTRFCDSKQAMCSGLCPHFVNTATWEVNEMMGGAA